jgi:Flp pilus assembly protein TadB
MSLPPNTGVSLDGAQVGDVAVGDVAGANVVKITGADANKIVDLLQAQIRYSWDDDQRRELRQAQIDTERRHDQNEASLRWEMMRQRFDIISKRLDHLDASAAATAATVARHIQWSRLIVAVLAVMIIAMALHYLGILGTALRASGIAAAILVLYYVRHR